MIKLTQDQKDLITSLSFLSNTAYKDIDIEKTLVYMTKRYIQPLKQRIDISKSSFADCGAGFGWLSFAYLLNGGKHATLCEIDTVRLKEAEQIADILKLKDKCTFLYAPMQELQFSEDQFDIFASIETLEHVGKENFESCISIMSKAAKKVIILTTPNRLFPLVFHDNKIPFSHWFPKNIRKYYVNFFGVKDNYPNDFVFPWELKPIKTKFIPFSITLTFESYEQWVESYPFYSPYNYGNRWKEEAPLFLRVVYKSLAIFFGRYSYYLSPNLCRLWIRKSDVPNKTS